MVEIPDGKFKDFYFRQLDFIEKNDVEGLIKNQYTEDASLRNYDTYVKGAPALVEFFKGYIGALGYIKLLTTDKYVQGDDSIMYEATVETAGGTAKVYDVWLMKGDKIYRHFAGLISFTPKA